MDAVDAFKEGHKAGVQVAVDLINRFAQFEAKTLAELIQQICEEKIDAGVWE